MGESPALSLAVKRLAGTRSNRVLDEETLAAARALPPCAIGHTYLEAVGQAIRSGHIVHVGRTALPETVS